MQPPSGLGTGLPAERFKVYRDAVSYLDFVEAMVRRLPHDRNYLVRQFRRAASSIVLNIAEGAGEFSRGEKARLYRIALRSSTECAAILESLSTLRLISDDQLQQGLARTREIAAQLTRLTKSMAR